jgi:hypothetical protein
MRDMNRGNKMTKFQKFQLYFSIVPGISSALVFFVTMFELKRQRATFKEWIKFMAIFFGFGALAAVIDTFVMSGENPILNVIVFTLIMALVNYLCINQQAHCETRSEAQENSHKKAKMITWIISGVIAFTTLIAVLVLALSNHIGSSHIDDINGTDDPSLAVITKEDFISVNNDYTATLTSESQTGQQTNVNEPLEDCDYTRCSVSAKRASGIHTLQATQTDANSITLHVESTLSGGNLEIIIVIDGEYDQHIPVNSKQSIVLEDVAEKLVLVKMAAESAEVNIVVEREITE